MNLEARYAIEASLVRERGSMTAMLVYGDGLAIFWRNSTEIWGPERPAPQFPFKSLPAFR